MICHRGSGKPRAILCSTEPLNTTSLQFLRIIATSLQAAYETRLVACSATLYTYAFFNESFLAFLYSSFTVLCVCVFFFFAYRNMLLHTQIEEAGNFFSFFFFSAMKVTGAYSNFCKGYIKKQDKQKRAGFTEK